jgi:hypothetical protein
VLWRSVCLPLIYIGYTECLILKIALKHFHCALKVCLTRIIVALFYWQITQQLVWTTLEYPPHCLQRSAVDSNDSEVPQCLGTANCNTHSLSLIGLWKGIISILASHNVRSWYEIVTAIGVQNDLFYFLWLCSPARAMVSSFTRFREHTQRRATVGRTPLDEWSARRRDLYLTTHNTQQTNIHDLGGIRTHGRSRRVTVDLTMHESLSYSFRIPKTIIWIIYRIKQLRN